MRRRPIPALLLLPLTASVLAALAGCGSSGGADRAGAPDPDSSSSASPTTGSTAGSGVPAAATDAPDDDAQHTCADAPASLVGPALHQPYLAPEETVNGPVTVCQYTSKDGLHLGVVRWQTGVTSLASEKKGFTDNDEPISDLSGVGDEALQSTIGTGSYLSHTIIVRQGNLELLITSQAPVAEEVALAKRLLG